MKRPALQWLILVPILAVVTLGLLGLSLYVDRYVHQDLIAQVDAELVRAEQARLVRRTQPGATAPRPNPERNSIDAVSAPVELLVDADGSLLDASGDDNPFDEADLSLLSTRRTGDFTSDGINYRIRTTPLRDGAISITALDISGVDAVMSNLRRALVAGSLVVLALQAVIVWFIASYLARPLSNMTNSARRIANGQLDTAIGEPSGSRETAALAVDLEQMLDQLRKTIEQSELSAEEARHARDQMERFLADASHELRTPLTALKGYAELYHGNMLQGPEALDRAMGRIGSESERMTRLVNDMLRLTRTGAFAEGDLSPMDARVVVANVVSDLHAAYPDTTIETKIDGELPIMVLGDLDQVHQSLLNIVANARHHIPSGTPITVSTSTDAAIARIRIIDHGPGIDPAVADKIFLPFFQVDESRVRDGDAGAGLGLAISKRIIDAHNGTVSVEQTPGGGATFVVDLPVLTSGVEHRDPAATEQDSPSMVTDG